MPDAQMGGPRAPHRHRGAPVGYAVQSADVSRMGYERRTVDQARASHAPPELFADRCDGRQGGGCGTACPTSGGLA